MAASAAATGASKSSSSSVSSVSSVSSSSFSAPTPSHRGRDSLRTAIELVDMTDGAQAAAGGAAAAGAATGEEGEYVSLIVPTGHAIHTPRLSICVAGGRTGDGRTHLDHPIHRLGAIPADVSITGVRIPNGSCCPSRWCIECPDGCLKSCLCGECNVLFQPCRRLVSTNKQRYERNGYSIDLTYISHRVITHGFPATGIEHVFRNPRYGVRRFLDDHHGENYHVFNFCAEPGRCYPASVFDGRVKRFPFYDHQVPKLHVLHQFCEEAAAWLDAAPAHVCALHCKAGKGRAGVMACCLLLRTGFRDTAVEIIEHYDRTRVKKKKKSGRQKGLTVPSQIRYVGYYEAMLRQSEGVGGSVNPGLLGRPPMRELRAIGVGRPKAAATAAAAVEGRAEGKAALSGAGASTTPRPHEASEESLPQLEARLRSNFPDPSKLPQPDGFRDEVTSADSIYAQLARERKRVQRRGSVGSGNPHTAAAGEFQYLVRQQVGFSGQTRDVWRGDGDDAVDGSWYEVGKGVAQVQGNFSVRVLRDGKKIGQAWLNTSLIGKGAVRLVLCKEEIDGLHKDRKHKTFAHDLQMVLEFGPEGAGGGGREEKVTSTYENPMRKKK
jgi:hypothetical protein